MKWMKRIENTLNMKRLLIEQLVIILTLCIYLFGFMDIPKSISDSSTKNLDFRNVTEQLHKNAVKNTVIMIIDALRTDHLIHSDQNYMEFSRELLLSEKGFGFMIHTETPTVTLPRIKSLLTGTIPGFMDVIFNFASMELIEENLVHFWKKSGRKVQFYGDDTWLRLFPNSFDKWNGVTSFFVSDYLEVDSNVTKHLITSLPSNSWDVMILHYLGLDHIGHSAGPASPLIPVKLKEMDLIIRQIYQELERKNETYLLLVCGDHGMSDAGGHGGASASEIMTSALMVSNLFKNKHKAGNNWGHQVDLASTLAILTGVAIPNKNIGVPLYPVLEFLPVDLKLQATHEVTMQLASNALSYLNHVEHEDMLNRLQKIGKMHSALIRSCREPSMCPGYETEAKKLSSIYEEIQRIASGVLAENKHSYDMFLLSLAAFSIFLVSVSILLRTILKNLHEHEKSRLPITFLVTCLISFAIIYYMKASFGCAFILSISLSFGISRVRCIVVAVHPTTMLKQYNGNFIQRFVTAFVVLHPLSLLATSFVEEEHQVFYFILSSLHFLFLANLLNTYFRKRKKSDTKVDSYFVNSLDNSRIRSFAGNILHANKIILYKTGPLVIAFVSWLIFRHLRYYNATGDKWRHLIYFNNILVELPEKIKYPLLLLAGIANFANYSVIMTFVVILVEYTSLFPYESTQTIFKMLTMILPYPIIFGIFIGKIATLMPIAVRFMSNNKSRMNHLYHLFPNFVFCFECFFALLFIVLQKRENYLCTLFSFIHFHLLLFFLVKLRCSLGLSETYVSIIVFWIANAHFFSHGNSNTLTTIRVAAGFVGVTSYSPVIHGLLIAVHTFGIKIIIYLHFIRLQAVYAKEPAGYQEVLRCWWIMQLIVLNIYLLVVTIQRYHLFIWSVFAPKLLYEGCNVICLFIVSLVTFVASRVARRVTYQLVRCLRITRNVP